MIILASKSISLSSGESMLVGIMERVVGGVVDKVKKYVYNRVSTGSWAFNMDTCLAVTVL